MRIQILQGDITTRSVDAIVNAANSSLLGGGGVDGAIHRAAGAELVEACRELRRTKLPGGLPVGAAVATPAFRLPARWVIHTVGPNRHAGQTDPALLASCFHESMKVAMGLGARSIAFPAISAGIYGWDARQVAEAAFDAVTSFSSSSSAGGAAESLLEVVEFVLFSEETTAVFRAVFDSSPVFDSGPVVDSSPVVD
ncbi:O-acetyl-ADP-ribose deacetylase [Paenarthrobacter nitroguajacolicus]|uniref:O-acetyl-ADP-ribose deacetylase n=1 Tax=Paenarthrobacter nitroguajacolicus TaxID=211146 RepID=UPI003AE18015